MIWYRRLNSLKIETDVRYAIRKYDETERRRLDALADLLDPFTFHQLKQIGIEPGWRCLEIGAGTGSVSQWIAKQLGGEGEVLCTDLQTDFITEIDHPLIRVEMRDITQPQPDLEPFDLVVVRAVHHHIPDRDAAARNLVSTVRPGGHILYVEPDIHPVFCDDHPAWKRLWQAFFQWGERRDIDYYTGRRVPAQLAAIGMDIVSVRGETVLFNGSEASNAARDLYRMTFDVVLQPMLDQGFLSKPDAEDAYALLDNPEAWLMSLCFFATHARKPVAAGGGDAE